MNNPSPDGTAQLGLESGTVVVVEYRPLWPTLYEAEARRIHDTAARHGVAMHLEHTGSTSVIGLAAKPVIDILAGIPSESVRQSALTALVDGGYSHRGEQGIGGRDFFRMGDPRQYHVHLVVEGSAFWDDHIDFRDWLRRHSDVAAEYGALKLQLASRYPTNRAAYIEGKTAFVVAVLKAARATKAR